MKNRRKNIGQTYDTDDVFSPSDQQRLVVSDDELMDGLVEAGCLGDDFAFGGGFHELGYRLFGSFAADVVQRAVEEDVNLSAMVF